MLEESFDVKANRFGLLLCNNQMYNRRMEDIIEGIRENNLTQSDINKMNELLYERLKNDGKYYFHQFELVDDKGVINGYRCKVLRYMSGNNQLKEADIDVCASYLEGVARELEKEIIANGK